MALLEDTLGSLGTAVLIGVGAALVVPALFPAAGAVLRPVAKSLIKGGLYIVDAEESISQNSIYY